MSVTFEIKSGFVGLQRKVIYSSNVAGPGNRCLEQAGGMKRALLDAAHTSSVSKKSVSSCPEMFRTIK